MNFLVTLSKGSNRGWERNKFGNCFWRRERNCIFLVFCNLFYDFFSFRSFLYMIMKSCDHQKMRFLWLFAELWVFSRKHDEEAERKGKCLEGAPLTALTARSNFCSVSLSYRIMPCTLLHFFVFFSGAHFFRMNGWTLLVLCCICILSHSLWFHENCFHFWCSHQKNVRDNHWTKRNFLSHSTMKNWRESS